MSTALTAPRFGRRLEPVEPRAQAQPETPAPAPPPPPAGSGQGAPPPDSIAELRTLCLARLDPAVVSNMPSEQLRSDIERLISELASLNRFQINAREQRALAVELVHDILGLGPLEVLLDDDAVTDIMVNGPARTFIERAGKAMLSDVKFRDTSHLIGICQRIAAAVGRRIDESSPMVDARLKDGSRVNIVFPPLALDGPYLSIRKFARRKIDLARLVDFGALTAPMARALQVAGRARLNIIISGGTGSGKTTLLNALSNFIDVSERVVTVEDAAELQLQQPHVVRLETRPPSLEGKGEITQRDLVRNALRMRPDRIIIGEVRGGEAFDMLQAMNTGHDGSMSTIHANTTRDALTRIENMVQMGNMGLPSRAIRTQIVGAVDLIVQVERQRDGRRRVTQITEICGMEDEVVALNDVFMLEIQGQREDGLLYGRYRVNKVPPAFIRRLAYFGLDSAWNEAVGEAAG